MSIPSAVPGELENVCRSGAPARLASLLSTVFRRDRLLLPLALGITVLTANLLARYGNIAGGPALSVAPSSASCLKLGLLTVDGLWHACTYAALFVMFGRTLLPRQEPLVTRLARRVHGELPADLSAYTRNVTILWSCFFFAQPALSVILAVTAPAVIWWCYINIFSWLMVGTVFVGEYLYRCWRFPHYRSATLREMVRSFRERNDKIPVR